MRSGIDLSQFLRTFLPAFDRKSLEMIYTSLIRPLLEYGDIVWDNCTQYEKEGHQKIQTKAARIATGTTKLISINSLNIEIKWDSPKKKEEKIIN